MAPTATQYANAVQVLVGPSPETTALLAAATDLDAAISQAAPVDAAVARWKAAQDALNDRLMSAIVDNLPIEELRRRAKAAGWSAPDGVQVSATLGPLSVAATASPHRLVVPGPGAIPPSILLGPLRLDQVTARLDAGPLKGKGRLEERPGGIAGVLAANLGVVEVAGLASLTRTPEGGPSFLAVLSAGFTPGLQLGFGLQINRIGGVVGIERRLDPPALAARLADGSASTALFPLDAGPAAAAALKAAEAILPPASGCAVVGPTFRLAWLEVAGQGFASVDLGVLMELPGPRRIALVGVLRAEIQPVVRLRADLGGVVDLGRQTATLDATLVDSGALGIFTVHGDLAFATSWGEPGYTVLSIGGFYPGFSPEPAQIRPLRRIGLALDNPLPGIRVRGEGYLAATSNTLQVGGNLELGVDAGIASITGFMGVDALVQFTPFHVNAIVAAGFSARFLGRTFGGVRFDGTIDGPGPVTLSGRVTIETFLKDLHWSDTYTFGSGGGPPAAGSVNPAQVVASQVQPSTIRAVRGGDSGVTLQPVDRDEGMALISPRGALAWSQHLVPLEVIIERVNGAPIGGTTFVTVQVNGKTGTPKERFAPGTFANLTPAAALGGPTYELLPSGVEVAGGADIPGPQASGESGPEVLRKVRGEVLQVEAVLIDRLAFPALLLALIQARDDPARVEATGPLVTLTPKLWSGGGRTFDTYTEALQMSSVVGAGPLFFRAPLSEADLNRPVVLAGL